MHCKRWILRQKKRRKNEENLYEDANKTSIDEVIWDDNEFFEAIDPAQLESIDTGESTKESIFEKEFNEVMKNITEEEINEARDIVMKYLTTQTNVPQSDKLKAHLMTYEPPCSDNKTYEESDEEFNENIDVEPQSTEERHDEINENMYVARCGGGGRRLKENICTHILCSEQ